MEFIKTLLEGLKEIQDPLTFWAFVSVVGIVALYAFLNSTRFHQLWSRTLGESLFPDQLLQLAKFFLVGFFLLLALVVLVAATAPLLLHEMGENDTKIEALQLSIDENEATRKAFNRGLRVFQEGKGLQESPRTLQGHK